MKRIMAALAGVTLGAGLLVGCAETYTFEAEPQGGNSQKPADIECFTIEADAELQGDDGDIQLGTFCKEDN